MKSLLCAKTFFLVCTVVVALLARDADATTIIHVNHAATGAQTGANWEDALTDLQDALAAADAVVAGGDDAEIWVAAGIYKPAADPADRSASFLLRSGVAIFGGFSGSETTRDERDVLSNETVLSGDIDANDLPPGESGCDATQIQGANSYHVVAGNGADATAVLDGFVITAGDAGDGDGGGISVTAGSALLRHLTICGNAAGRGGALCSGGDGTAVTVENALLSRNTARSGGAIENAQGSVLLLTHCTIANNTASNGHGGGLDNIYSTATLVNVRIIGNSAAHTDEEFGGNRGWGGAIYNSGTSRCDAPADLTMTGVLVYGNYAISGGGIVLFGGGDAVLTNVTMSENSASHGPDALILYTGSFGCVTATVHSSIIWANPSGEDAVDDIYSHPGTRLLPDHTAIPFALPGGSNIDEDPLFGDLGHLLAGSPAIDGGSISPGLPPTDLDGNPRVIGAAIDMGAYEYEPPLTLHAEMTPVTCHGGTTGAIDLTVAGGTGTYEIAWSPTAATTEDLTGIAAGTYTVTVTDTNGCEETLSVNVNEPPVDVVTLSIAPMGNRDDEDLPIVQYSDVLELNATTAPALNGTIVYTLKRGTVVVQNLGIATVLDGVAETLDPVFDPPRGRTGRHYVEAVFVSSDGCVTVATRDVIVDSEDAILTPHPSNGSAFTEAEANAGFTLEFTIREAFPEPAGNPPGVEPGDINVATVYAQLFPVGGSVETGGNCTPGAAVPPHEYVERTFTCSFIDLPVDTYELNVTTGTTAFRASYVDTLTIYDPSAGLVTGGGKFIYPGSEDRVNFGLVYRLTGKDRTTPRGNLLVIRHLENGDICRAKSNGVGAPSVSGNTAGFSGKGNYLCTRPDGTTWGEEGNLAFAGWVEDNDATGEPDRFWIRIPGTALTMEKPSVPNAAPLTGGNIQVPQKDRK